MDPVQKVWIGTSRSARELNSRAMCCCLSVCLVNKRSYLPLAMTLKTHALINKIQFFVRSVALISVLLILSPFLLSIMVAWWGAIKDVVITGYEFSTDVKLAMWLAEWRRPLALLIANPLGSGLIHFIALATLQAVNLVMGEVYSQERKLLLSILWLDRGRRPVGNGEQPVLRHLL